MNLDLSDEQQLIAETADRLFSAPSSMEIVREAHGEIALKTWRDAVEIGFVGMRITEAVGGSNSGLLDAALVCEAAGRGIAAIPLSDGIAACRLLSIVGGPRATELLDGLAETPLSLSKTAGVTSLSLEGASLVVTAPDGERTIISEGERTVAAYTKAINERAILRAAWLIGASTRSVELAAAYASERKQFGHPIGAFQGVAFPLADAITDAEAGRLLVWHAIWSIANGEPRSAAGVAMAAWWAATRSRIAVRRALRSFGGYGLSVEYDIHLYFLAINREALADGDPEERLALVGDYLWGEAETTLPDVGEPGIDLGLGAKAEAFAAAVRQFFDRELSPELRSAAHHSTDGHDADFHRKLAAAGFAYPDWPKEWGGDERTAMEMTALGRVFEEFRWTRVPIGITNMGARMVMKFGTPGLQSEVIPRLADGSALSCLGFSEPDSGSDMYAARTRAVREGDDWLITGQKMFTTGAHIADYVLLIARTSPDKPKHRGLTVFLVPMSLPGISIQAVHTLQDERTNITFYDQVRVADRYRLGPVDGGLTVMAAAMDIEHGGEGYHIYHYSLFDAALTWAKTPGHNGAVPIEDARTRSRLARIATHLRLADLMSRRATWAGSEHKLTRASGPMAKLFATEAYMKDAADLAALTAPASLHPTTPALVEIDDKHRQSIGQTIYGGTSEIHRTIIAQHRLGLPRLT